MIKDLILWLWLPVAPSSCCTGRLCDTGKLSPCGECWSEGKHGDYNDYDDYGDYNHDHHARARTWSILGLGSSFFTQRTTITVVSENSLHLQKTIVVIIMRMVMMLMMRMMTMMMMTQRGAKSVVLVRHLCRNLVYFSQLAQDDQDDQDDHDDQSDEP